MVLKGEAGPGLLESYDRERRPVGELTVQQAYGRYATRVVPERGTGNVEPPVDDLIIEIGYRYRSAAIADDAPVDFGPDEAPVFAHPDTLRGRPGSRAPHVVLGRNGESISTLDVFGRHFVVLGGPEGGDWCTGAQETAHELGIPIDAWQIGAGGLEDVDGRFLEAYELAPAGAVLVRPDGFVAWRTNAPPEHAAQDLGRVVTAILDRAGDSGAAKVIFDAVPRDRRSRYREANRSVERCLDHRWRGRIRAPCRQWVSATASITGKTVTRSEGGPSLRFVLTSPFEAHDVDMPSVQGRCHGVRRSNPKWTDTHDDDKTRHADRRPADTRGRVDRLHARSGASRLTPIRRVARE